MPDSPKPLLKASDREAKKIVSLNGQEYIETAPPTIEALGKTFLVLCEQYQQMGQQLKHMGACIGTMEQEEAERETEKERKRLVEEHFESGKGKPSE